MAQIIGTNTVTNGLVFAWDAANKKSLSANTFFAPKDPFAFFGPFGATNCTISRDHMLSPNGGKCLRMDVTAGDPYVNSWNAAACHIVRAAPGETWTASCWVKGAQSGGNVEGIGLFEAKEVGTFNAGSTSGSPSIGTSWTRITTTRTISDATTTFIQLRPYGPQSGGTGQTYWWADFQLEKSSTVTDFNPTISTGNTNVVNMVGSIRTSSIGVTYTSNAAIFTRLANASLNIDYATLSPALSSLAVTVSAWVKVDAHGDFIRFVNNGWLGNGWLLFATNSTWSWGVAQSGAQINTFSAHGNSTAWTQLTGTYDGTNIKLYVNGTLQSTEALSAATLTTNATINIGTSNAPEAGDKQIASTHIYNRALTAAEVTQNFNQTRGRFGV